MNTLFYPVDLGELKLPNRMVMSPLTRCRASEGRVPNALMAEYYTQRATAGLIISEATSVTPMGVGYPDTPGIWSDEQFTKERANRVIAEGTADAVAFGRAYIANPDLVDRFRKDATLNELDTRTLYGSGPGGYVDYPFLDG